MSRRALAVIAALLAAALVVGLVWRERPRAAALDAAQLVPEDAQAVVQIDDPGALLEQLGRLGRRVRGAQGLAEALALALGLQQPTPAALDDAGLRADSPAVAFVWRGAVWVALAAHGEAGRAHVRSWLEQRGWLVEAAPQRWTVRHATTKGWRGHVAWTSMGMIAWAPLPPAWREALGRPPGPPKPAAGGAPAEGGAPGGESATTPEARLASWQAAPKRAALEGAGGVHAAARLGKADDLRPAVRKALGLGSLLFGGMIDAVEGLAGDLALTGEAPALALRANTVRGANKDTAAYYDGFLAKGSAPLALGDVLPDEVALWGVAHANPKLLGMVPGFLRDKLLPKDLLRGLDPRLAGVDAQGLLLDQLEGRVAVGLLGLDDAQPLDPRAWQRAGLRRAFGGFAALTLKSEAAAAALATAILGAAGGPGSGATALRLGAWTGHAVALGGVPSLLLRRGNALLLVSGKGERERFERAARGRFPTWGKAATTAQEKAIAADNAGWIAVGSTLGRVARAARRRGVPDAFVQMIRSVAALSAAVRLDADGLALRLEARPRQPPEAP